MEDAIKSMGGSGEVVRPNQDIQDFHRRKYQVFLKMVAHQNEYKKIMNSQ